MKIVGYASQVDKCFHGHLPYLSMFNSSFWLQVQKLCESLKKRKDPGTFSEQGDTLQNYNIGYHFASLILQQ
jgi:hypothetical protein